MNAALATTFLLLAPSAYAASTSQRQHHLAPDNECNLCSRNVTLLLATGRSGSTSLLEAINSLPGVALRGESDASLFGAWDLYRRAIRPDLTANEFAPVEHGYISNHRLLCSLQSFFFELASPANLSNTVKTGRARGPVTIYGFKELVMPSQTIYSQAPDAHEHRPDAPDGWFNFTLALFPCANIIFNYRRDTSRQANSTFFEYTNTSAATLKRTNEIIEGWHERVWRIRSAAAAAAAAADSSGSSSSVHSAIATAAADTVAAAAAAASASSSAAAAATDVRAQRQQKGEPAAAAASDVRAPRSYMMALEEFTPKGMTQLARWLGFPECTYLALPHANDPDVAPGTSDRDLVHGDRYHSDYEHVRLECGGQ